MGGENLLTDHGKTLEKLEPDQFGAPGEQARFTADQVAQALCSKACLLLQIDDADKKDVTSEIALLLRTRELVKSATGYKSLFTVK